MKNTTNVVLLAVLVMQCVLLGYSFIKNSENDGVLYPTPVAKADLIARIHVNAALIGRLEQNENEEVIEFLSNEVRLLILSLDDASRETIEENIREKYVDGDGS